MKDKKIEEILQKFRYTLEFNAIDMGDMLGKETVFITNDSEELTDWLRQTLLKFQQEVREEARKETIKMIMSRIDSKGFYDFINDK